MCVNPLVQKRSDRLLSTTFALSLENGTNLSTDRVSRLHISQNDFIIYHNAYASEPFREISFLLSSCSLRQSHLHNFERYIIFGIILYALNLLSHTSIIFFKVNGSWIFKSRIEDIRVYLRYLCPLLTLSCKRYIFLFTKTSIKMKKNPHKNK